MSNILKSRQENWADSRHWPPGSAEAASVRFGVLDSAVVDVAAFGRSAGFDSPEVRADVNLSAGVDAYVQPSQSEGVVDDVAQAQPATVAIEQPSVAAGATERAAVVLEANGISTAPFGPARPVAESVVPDHLDAEEIRDELPGIYAAGAGN